MKQFGDSFSLRRVIASFLVWKTFLLLVACASPGPGYDTSTQILFDQYGPRSSSIVAKSLEHLAIRLTRWDGIYFAANAERGHVNEQDWAFSWVLARVNDGAAKVFFSPLSISPIIERALCGIIISHVSHLLTVVILYQLTAQLIPESAPSRSRIAFTAATLHILSPAGLFLSAPYGESAFAFLNFAGTWSYSRAVQFRCSPRQGNEAFYTIISGIFLALAASIRSNGLLNGIFFAWDALETLLHPRRLLSIREIGRLAAPCIAGMLVGIGFALPQVVAYMEFCSDGHARPWCDKVPPSIYNWVQDHYWRVGFLRYWTLSNLPLFLVAAPVLGLLLATGFVCVWKPGYIARSLTPAASSKLRHHVESKEMKQKALASILRRLALPQLILAAMTATTFHVQIINRISSGYPLWYIVLAVLMHSQSSSESTISNGGVKRQLVGRTVRGNSFSENVLQGSSLQVVVRGMALYAIFQGGLYASFLPPA